MLNIIIGPAYNSNFTKRQREIFVWPSGFSNWINAVSSRYSPALGSHCHTLLKKYPQAVWLFGVSTCRIAQRDGFVFKCKNDLLVGSENNEFLLAFSEVKGQYIRVSFSVESQVSMYHVSYWKCESHCCGHPSIKCQESLVIPGSQYIENNEIFPCHVCVCVRYKRVTYTEKNKHGIFRPDQEPLFL